MPRKPPHLNSGQSHLTACIMIVVVIPGVVIGALRVQERLRQEQAQETHISQRETGRDIRRWIQTWWPWAQDWNYYSSVSTDMQLHGVQFSYDPEWRIRSASSSILLILPTRASEHTAELLDAPTQAAVSVREPTVQEDVQQSIGLVLADSLIDVVVDQSLIQETETLTVQGRPTTIYRLAGRTIDATMPEWFARPIRVDVVDIGQERRIGFVFSDAIEDVDAQRLVDSVRWSLGNK